MATHSHGKNKLVIPWPEFGDSVRAALLSYTDDVADAIAKEAQRAAKQTRVDIQSAAPKRSGEYAKSWTVRKETVDRRRPAFVVHAKKPGYQLAHLLERSHRIVNQYGEYGHTTPKPHIEPAAVKNGERFTKNVVNAIKNLS